MKTSTIKIILIVAFLFSACQKQTPVELVDKDDDSKLINVQSLPPSIDSLYLISEEDTSGNVGMLNKKFYGKLIHQTIRIDRPIRSDSFSIAEAIFLDKNKPIRHNNRIIAYHSYDVGTLKFNNRELNKIQRRFRIPMMGDSAIGYIYQLRHTYENTLLNRWTALGGDSILPFTFSFSAPPPLRIINLSPGFINISEPLYIKWNCTNPEINLYISAEAGDLVRRQLVPVLHLKIKNTKGEITIPTRILELLPVKKYSHFIFTFTSEYKQEREVAGYSEKILVYSASVHSILLNLRYSISG